MASYNLRNAIRQGIQIGYYRNGVSRFHTIDAGDSYAFEADFLTPETEVAIRSRSLVPVTGAMVPPPGAPGTVVPGFGLQYRQAWDATLRYYPGDLVAHGGAFIWLCSIQTLGVPPGTDDAIWSVFGAPGFGGVIPSISALQDRVDAIETDLFGTVPIRYASGPGNPSLTSLVPGFVHLWRDSLQNRLRLYFNAGSAGVHRSPAWSPYVPSITIDNNIVTIDSTDITIDATAVTIDSDITIDSNAVTIDTNAITIDN